MKKTWFAVILLCGVGLPAGGVIYLRYWNVPAFTELTGANELSPEFRKQCGPVRFKQYFSSAIPAGISNIEGGYTGFPQGMVQVNFQFQGALQNYPFMKAFAPVAEAPMFNKDWQSVSWFMCQIEPYGKVYIGLYQGTNSALLLDL